MAESGSDAPIAIAARTDDTSVAVTLEADPVAGSDRHSATTADQPPQPDHTATAPSLPEDDWQSHPQPHAPAQTHDDEHTHAETGAVTHSDTNDRDAAAADSSRPLSDSVSVSVAPSPSVVDGLLSELSSLNRDATADGGGDGAGDAGAAPQFVKSLSSDVDAAEALALFRALRTDGSGGSADSSGGDNESRATTSSAAAAAPSSYFAEYSDAELGDLSAAFSVLRVAEGETIMTRGETATFVAVVLSGRCAAVLSAAQRVPLGPGQLLGEMALFVGGVRTADIVTAEESTLAVLSFAELDALPMAGERWRRLQTKLLKTFAVASISKLRATIAKASAEADASSAAATAVAAVPVAAASTATTPVMSPLPSPDARSTRSLVAPQPAPGFSRESLYRVRLALEKDKNAARQAASAERALRLAVEQKNQSAHASVERYRVLSERLKAEIQALVARNNELQLRMEPAQTEIAKLEAALARRDADNEALQAKLAAAKMAVEAAERAAEGARLQALQESERSQDELHAQMEQSRVREAELQAALEQAAVDADARVAAEAARTAAVQHDLEAALQRESTLREEVAQRTAEAARAQEETRVTEASLASCTLSLSLARAEALEESGRARDALVHQSRLEELEAAALADRKASRIAQSHLLARVSTLSHDLSRYRLLLLHVTTAAFVKLHRLKRAVRAAHMQISEMLVDILEMDLVATGGRAAGAGAGTGAGAGEADALGATVMEGRAGTGAALVSGPGSVPDGGVVASDASLALLRKRLVHRKRAYLESVEKKVRGPSHADRAAQKRPHGVGALAQAASAFQAAGSGASSSSSSSVLSLSDLLSSLEDELLKLRRPFLEVAQRLTHWKRTSECFFARSVELTSHLLQSKESADEAKRAERAARDTAQEQQAEIDAAQAVVAALRSELAQLHSANQSLRAQARTLAESADHVGARKSEVEALDSQIAMRKAQLQYVQQRYVQTAHALRGLAGAAAPAAPPTAAPDSGGAVPAAHAETQPSAAAAHLSLSPPRPPPHYPPPPPSAANVWGHSPSMTELFAATLGISVPGGSGTDGAAMATHPGGEQGGDGSADPSRVSLFPAAFAASVPPPHLDPEAFHSQSLRLFAQTTQQQFALEELDKWRAVQFVLENAPEPPPRGSRNPPPSQRAGKSKNRKSGGRDASAASSLDPLVESLSARAEVSALGLTSNYASVFSSRHYTPLDPALQLRAAVPDDAFGTAPPRSRAEEEEAKQAWMAGSATHRIRDIKTRMGNAAEGGGGGGSSLRAANQFHSDVASRNSSDIAQNGSLRSVGASPARPVAGGAAAPSLRAQSMSTYSSVIPAPTTSERLAPDFSRTLMLLRPGLPGGPGAASGSGSGGPSSLVRQFAGAEGGGARNFAEVYAAAAGSPTTSYARAVPPPVPSAAAAAALRASVAELRMAPASAYVHSAAATAAGLSSSTQPLRSARGPGQFASATSLGAATTAPAAQGGRSARGSRPAASPKSKRLQLQHAPPASAATGPGHGFAPPPSSSMQTQPSHASLFPLLSPRSSALASDQPATTHAHEIEAAQADDGTDHRSLSQCS